MVVSRYSRSGISSLWSDHSKWRIILDIELAVCEYLYIRGDIPADDYNNIVKKADFNIDRILEIEKETKHDIIAFLTNVAENVGASSRFIHKGLTSSDVIDTAFSIQLSKSCDIILSDIDNLLSILKKQSLKYKNLLCIGRSHGIHAEPTVFGLKFARFYAEFKRHKKRLLDAKKDIAVCKISGAVGNFANIDHEIESFVAKKFNLEVDTISTQVIPRDRHAYFFSVLGCIASSIENVSIEMRHLQRTEVLEASEYFSSKQKGSSAMPHKRNPILSENLTGLARLIRSYVIPAMENTSLWHERDISHSSVERFIAPDACVTLDFALYRLCDVMDNCIVHEHNVKNNLFLSKGLVFSQKIMLKLVDAGYTREEAYLIVQQNASKVLEEKHSKDFISLIKLDKRVISKITEKEVDDICSLSYYLSGINIIYDRVFI